MDREVRSGSGLESRFRVPIWGCDDAW